MTMTIDFFVAPLSLNFVKDIGAVEVLQLLLFSWLKCKRSYLIIRICYVSLIN